MTKTIPRLAASVFTALFAVAVLSVSTAHAEDGDPISTTCGAGTIEPCGTAALTQCDWTIDISYMGGYTFSFKMGKTNCRVIGTIPIYKNRNASSSLSGSCSALSPILGMPAGTGCSIEDEV